MYSLHNSRQCCWALCSETAVADLPHSAGRRNSRARVRPDTLYAGRHRARGTGKMACIVLAYNDDAVSSVTIHSDRATSHRDDGDRWVALSSGHVRPGRRPALDVSPSRSTITSFPASQWAGRSYARDVPRSLPRRSASACCFAAQERCTELRAPGASARAGLARLGWRG